MHKIKSMSVNPKRGAGEAGDDGKNEKNAKIPKIDRRVSMTHSHSNHLINVFLTFRRHVTCTNRFNVYIHNLKTEYEKNNYFRIRQVGGGKFEYDLFLPLPPNPNWHWFLRAVYESINNENILKNDSEPLILNMTSVYENHLKRIVNKSDENIHTWFENSKKDNGGLKRKLHTDLIATTRNVKTLIFAPRKIQQLIKNEPSSS